MTAMNSITKLLSIAFRSHPAYQRKQLRAETGDPKQGLLSFTLRTAPAYAGANRGAALQRQHLAVADEQPLPTPTIHDQMIPRPGREQTRGWPKAGLKGPVIWFALAVAIAATGSAIHFFGVSEMVEPLVSGRSLVWVGAALLVAASAFLAFLVVLLLEGQRSQHRQITKLNRDVEKVNNRLMTPSEREARAARAREIEEQNRAVRELYESGEC